MPSWMVATPRRPAIARPSDCGSMPIRAATSSDSEVRMILIIRSVPILPEPMIATFVFMQSIRAKRFGPTHPPGRKPPW